MSQDNPGVLELWTDNTGFGAACRFKMGHLANYGKPVLDQPFHFRLRQKLEITDSA